MIDHINLMTVRFVHHIRFDKAHFFIHMLRMFVAINVSSGYLLRIMMCFHVFVEVPATYGFTVEVGDSHLSPPLATRPQFEVSRFVSDSTRVNSGASHPNERY